MRPASVFFDIQLSNSREGSRIVLEDRPEQGKNKVEVRFFLEDGQVRGMEPWIFTCE